MQLSVLLESIKQYSGLYQKKEIQLIGEQLTHSYQYHDYLNGDDTAAILNGNGYDLLASEGFLTDFVVQDPWFAGWCSVMVNISDIAAMGGRPTAVVNTFWGDNKHVLTDIFSGMSAASCALHIPIVGGHTNLHSNTTQLAVSVLGKATTLLSSFSACSGHALVAALDLRGNYHSPFLNWNAATTAPPERLRGDLALLPYIAEHGLAIAAKDISQAGLLGTCVMLLECSQVGAEIELQKIPKPAVVSWLDWLRSFPSFGYLLTTPIERVNDLIEVFSSRNITASHIGNITERPDMIIKFGDQIEHFWDIKNQPLTGMSKHCTQNHIL